MSTPKSPIRLLTLLAYYAGGYWMLSGLISAVIWVIIATQGTGVLTEVIWFKIFCSGLFIVRHIKRKQLEIPFFRNTGLWETPLWTGAIGIDLLTFMTGVIILIKHV